MGNKACLCCEEIQQKDQKDMIDIEVLKKNSINEGEDKEEAHESFEKINSLPIESDPLSTLPELIEKPDLLPAVKENLLKANPFQQSLPKYCELRKYGSIIYEGETNEKKQPHGFGSMYYLNGAVFVGKFSNGRADGPAHYVLPDGSFYRGQVKNNVAEDLDGHYESAVEGLIYRGGVKNNLFEGEGSQNGKKHEFKGLYAQGRRVKGTLKWNEDNLQEIYGNDQKNAEQNKDQVISFSNLMGGPEMTLRVNKAEGEYDFEYIGSFDHEGLFTGIGTLKSQKGTYNGNFLKGKKEGEGVFEFKNGLKYEGQYKNNLRHGKGTIYGKTSKIAYCGQIENGMPHGRGYVLNSNNQKIYMQWREGISSKIEQINSSAFKSNLK